MFGGRCLGQEETVLAVECLEYGGVRLTVRFRPRNKLLGSKCCLDEHIVDSDGKVGKDAVERKERDL
jgi:hypothetical protein